jgi:hypothetical protein
MEGLLATNSQCGFTPEIAERVRIFILLQRWYGLACIDAATLPRNLLRADDAHRKFIAATKKLFCAFAAGWNGPRRGIA